MNRGKNTTCKNVQKKWGPNSDALIEANKLDLSQNFERNLNRPIDFGGASLTSLQTEKLINCATVFYFAIKFATFLFFAF